MNHFRGCISLKSRHLCKIYLHKQKNLKFNQVNYELQILLPYEGQVLDATKIRHFYSDGLTDVGLTVGLQ